MTLQSKIVTQTGLAFGLTIIMIFYLIHHQGSHHAASSLSYPLLGITLLAILFAVVVILMQSVFRMAEQEAARAEKDLEALTRSLKETTTDLENHVERRTFEISVANASLNREIAERIQAEAEMKKVQRQMELILESAGDGIFGLDADGNVTFMNRAASNMLGWSAEELIGKSHHDLVHHSYTDGSRYPVDSCPISQAYLDGKVHVGADEIFWTRDGKGFPVEYISTPIIEQKKFTGAVVVFREVHNGRDHKAANRTGVIHE
ncbi:PAS domain-containing protein [Desulfogranum japonicum]|uniref:PAS domain-containing protein n=1 Tax=Desulfogranum japonicum TaxID=231447 RepID=UPI000408926D|nr:PAS domain-containing protein [Desulfogranum japonicum]